MGKPYSDDLRERVVSVIEVGHTREEVAELYNMALSTVGGFIKRKRETGSVSPDKFGGYNAGMNTSEDKFLDQARDTHLPDPVAADNNQGQGKCCVHGYVHIRRPGATVLTQHAGRS
jgi:hypothetical protein